MNAKCTTGWFFSTSAHVVLSLKVPLILLLLLLAFTASGQMTGRDRRKLELNGPYHQRVVVPDHMTLVLNTSDVRIDTLIMDRKSVLKIESSTRLTVGYAVIGKKCLIDGRGKSGIGVAGRGTNGKPLNLTITFHELGRLTINTSGGTGSNGYRGRPGSPGISGGTSTADGGAGGPGGPGGDGGDGGNLTLLYRCVGFSPVFEKAKRNSLFINNKGGKGGGGGAGGPGGPGGRPTRRQYVGARGETVTEWNGVQGSRGPSGPTGEAGDPGRDGVLVVKEM